MPDDYHDCGGGAMSPLLQQQMRQWRDGELSDGEILMFIKDALGYIYEGLEEVQITMMENEVKST